MNVLLAAILSAGDPRFMHGEEALYTLAGLRVLAQQIATTGTADHTSRATGQLDKRGG